MSKFVELIYIDLEAPKCNSKCQIGTLEMKIRQSLNSCGHRHNNILSMKLEEAIVYLLASSGYGMKIEQIAREINERKLFVRRGGVPVDGKMVYAVVMSHPEMFCKSEGRIRLMI